MDLKQRITTDMKVAMKARDSDRLNAIRLLMAAMKQKEIDARIELDDAGIGVIIDKMLKQRRDSMTQYEAAGRQDLADQEKYEILVLNEYRLPQLSEAEIEAAITASLAEHGNRIQDMKKIMTALRPVLGGKADFDRVIALVKSRLI
jgi:uncharacterized protein YqeY